MIIMIITILLFYNDANKNNQLTRTCAGAHRQITLFHICVYMCICICVGAHMYIYLYLYIYCVQCVCMYVCVYIYIYTH